MGSKSDMPAMEKAAAEVLTERGILHEVRVMSAHRDPEMVADYAKNARMRGLRVIIAGAGLSAALPGVVAAHADLPVIGVPLTVQDLEPPGGLDALLSIVADAAGRAGGLRGLDNARNAAVAGGAHLGGSRPRRRCGCRALGLRRRARPAAAAGRRRRRGRRSPARRCPTRSA